jgi:hypothetical protein
MEATPDVTGETRDRFIKLIAGTVVGFIATKLTEDLVGQILEKRRAN